MAEWIGPFTSSLKDALFSVLVQGLIFRNTRVRSVSLEKPELQTEKYDRYITSIWKNIDILVAIPNEELHLEHMLHNSRCLFVLLQPPIR